MDYKGILNDLRDMEKRLREFILNMPYVSSLAIEARELHFHSREFRFEIQEMIACQLTEERMN